MNHCQFCGKEAANFYCSLSCSNKARTAKNEAKYMLHPKRCKSCENPIAYAARFSNIYCSKSCAAHENNKIPKRKKKVKVSKSNWITKALILFQEGKLVHRRGIRKCLIATIGNFCVLCQQNNVWCNKPLTLVVDHINGDAGNNMPSNLRLLCPNCNSQTPTFCGRNYGNGRESRGLSKS